MLGYYTSRYFSHVRPVPCQTRAGWLARRRERASLTDQLRATQTTPRPWKQVLPRRILFAIRSKLGDTLISFQCVRAFADAYPESQVTLLTRSAYATLLRAEDGIRVIGFNSRIEMTVRLLWLRFSEPAFDVLAVLWGSGPPIRLIGRLVKAARKIAWSRKFAPDVFEEGRLPQDPLLIDPATSAIRVFAPNFASPRALAIPSLGARYRVRCSNTAIGIAPIADEARRNLDPATLLQLIGELRRKHPQAPIRVFVNPGNAGSEALIAMALPAGCELRSFRDLAALVSEYMNLAEWVGTDTGLYHLAVAIGIPATVFFGPTQPHKIVMPAQKRTRAYRLAALKDTHCEEKACTRPLCLHACLAVWSHAAAATRLEETAPACPLRALPRSALENIRDCSPA